MKPDCPQDIAQLAALDIEHRIVVALNPPSDQPHRASAVLAAAHCIRLFLEPLELPNGELRDIRKALGRGDDALAPTGLQLRGRTSRYPAWRAALLVRTDSLEFVRRAFGAMLVEALLTDYPIGKTRASKLVTALQGRIDWAYLQRRIDSVHTLAGEDTRARLSLRERLRGHYRAPHGNPGEHAHQLRLDDRSLSPERYSIAARVIRSAVEAGETWACWSALGVVTGLPLDLVAALPIRSPCVANSECALLDLQRGQYHFDLTVIAPNPRTRPAPAIECIPATSYLTRPLPEFLCRALASTQDIRPTATSVEELLDTCPDRARDPCEGVFRGAIRPTLARLQNSTELVAVHLGIEPAYATLISGRVNSVPNARLYYQAVESIDVWAAAQALYSYVGFGEPAPPVDGPAIGALAVAPDAAVQRWFCALAADVDSVWPGNRCGFERLIRFHNAYALAVGSVLAFLFALRHVAAWPDAGDVPTESDWVTLRDKRSRTAWNSTAETALDHGVAVCRVARDQIRAWRQHCAGMSQRLERLGAGAHRPVAGLQERFQRSSADDSPVYPFVVRADYSTAALGSNDLVNSWPLEHRRDANWPRAYWCSKFVSMKVRSRAIDTFLRHSLAGCEPQTTTDGVALADLLDEIRYAQDLVCRELRLAPIKGLRK